MNHLSTRHEAIKTGATVALAGTMPSEAHATQPTQPKGPTVEGYTDQLSYTAGDKTGLVRGRQAWDELGSGRPGERHRRQPRVAEEAEAPEPDQRADPRQ